MALHLDHPTLFAHSMGTVLATSYLAAHPDQSGEVRPRSLRAASLPW